MDQQQQPQQDPSAPQQMSGANALNGNMPSVDANGNFLDPNAMQGMMNNGGMMNGQNYMVDPSMGGMNGFMPMGNEQLMLPLMQQPNGHSQAPQPPRNLNAGEQASPVALKRSPYSPVIYH
jgi:hypothetical protein